MERFIKQVTEIEEKAKTSDPWKLIKPAHSLTAKAILRVMHAQKRPKTDILHAKRFLETSGYDAEGKPLELTMQSYLAALELKEKGKIHVLSDISDAAQAITRQMDHKNVETAFARNPLAHILAHIENVHYFLNRAEVDLNKQEILASGLSDLQKRRLVDYLEQKR